MGSTVHTKKLPEELTVLNHYGEKEDKTKRQECY